MKNSTSRDIEFLYEIGSLKNTQRGWRQHLGMNCASILEHTLRVVWIAVILARMEGADENLVIRMALVHDIAESRTLDFSYIQKVYIDAHEARTAQDLFRGTSLENFREESLAEYEKRETLEAKIVKDADNIDIDLELKELDERGSKLPAKWKNFRRKIRDEKLYTESAKRLWDAIQESDPSSWHLVANKWLKIPDAGK